MTTQEILLDKETVYTQAYFAWDRESELSLGRGEDVAAQTVRDMCDAWDDVQIARCDNGDLEASELSIFQTKKRAGLL